MKIKVLDLAGLVSLKNNIAKSKHDIIVVTS